MRAICGGPPLPSWIFHRPARKELSLFETSAQIGYCTFIDKPKSPSTGRFHFVINVSAILFIRQEPTGILEDAPCGRLQ